MDRRAFLRACRGALLGAAIAFPRVSLAVAEGEGWESEVGKQYDEFTITSIRLKRDIVSITGRGDTGTLIFTTAPDTLDCNIGDIVRVENPRWTDAE